MVNKMIVTIKFIYIFKADNKVVAGKAGVIEAIVKIMNIHINDVDVCKNCCGVIMNITGNCK